MKANEDAALYLKVCLMDSPAF